MKMQSLRYNVILKPEPECGYTVLVPSLPGCVSYGAHVDEAIMIYHLPPYWEDI